MSDPKQDEVPLPQSRGFVDSDGDFHGHLLPGSVYAAADLITYGNARARAATERAAQVCRERGGRLQWLADCRRESDACADAILADAGIKGDGSYG
jgi:hypothetical protein